MDDNGDDKEDTKRRSRNLSEKKRRDQFNMLINQLGSMVSMNRSRKMDKSSVLRATISYLRSHNEQMVLARENAVHRDWKPPFLPNEDFAYLEMEAMECFILVFAPNGQIHYVSDGIASLVGYDPGEVVNQNIYDMTYTDDRPTLTSILHYAEMNAIIEPDEEMSFQLRILRCSPDNSNETEYELIDFNGHYRTNIDFLVESDDYQLDDESRTLFVCTGRLFTPQLIRDVSLVDNFHVAFTSRHSLEWKFLFLDHRAPAIIGYLPFEVLGTSGYDYYHFDDLEKLTDCHESLMQRGELTTGLYRFLTKGQQWLWIQSRFYITYHQWNSKPEFVVCSHRVVNYANVSDNMREVRMEPEAEINAEPEDIPNVMDDNTTEETLSTAISPSFISEPGDVYGNSYPSTSKAMSVMSADTAAGTVASTSASWPHGSNHTVVSDNASISSEPPQKPGSKPNGVGMQFLEPSSYVRPVETVGVSSILPLTVPSMTLPSMPLQSMPLQSMPLQSMPLQSMSLQSMPLQSMPLQSMPLQSMPLQTMQLPVIVTDQAQIHEQLHRKHEELQHLLVRQQEELRQVKEQLLLARLGILHPLINVQNSYVTPVELQRPQPRMIAPQTYESDQPRRIGPQPYPTRSQTRRYRQQHNSKPQ